MRNKIEIDLTIPERERIGTGGLSDGSRAASWGLLLTLSSVTHVASFSVRPV